MNALITFRQLIVLFVFALAAATASASDGGKNPRKAAPKSTTAASGSHQRKVVAPFADPTLPLTEFVERVRTERAR